MDGIVEISVRGLAPSGLTRLITKSGSGVHLLEESIPDESSDLAVVFNLDVSATKIFVMVSDQNLTVKTNSDSAPQETINLAANSPLLWIAGEDGFASPFANDVTALYVSNASGAAANLIIQALTDVAP